VPNHAAKLLAPGARIPATDVVDLEGPLYHNEKREFIGFCDKSGSLISHPYRFVSGTIEGMQLVVGVDPKYAGQKMHARRNAT
jgi:hypothetical protein